MSENKFQAGLEPTEKKKRNNSRLASALVLISLVILANPNFTTVDIFPDFIAYLIIAAMAKRYASLAPYFAEVREGCLKLGAITLLKLPAMVMMFAMMSSGRDIVPLMTLVFVALELIVLFPTLGNAFSALFYLGERSGAGEFVAPFRVWGLDVHTDFLRAVAFVFVGVKGILNIIPEFCLLTFDTDTTVAALRSLYPKLEVFSLLLVLIVGIFTLVLARGYMKAIAGGIGLADAVYSIVDNDRLASYEYTRKIRTRLSAMTLLFITSLLTLDISFTGSNYDMTDALNDGLTILPRFVYAVFLVVLAVKIFGKKRLAISIYIGGGAYTLFSILNTIFTKQFLAEFNYSDLLSEGARAAYIPTEIFATLETLSMAVMVIPFCLLFIGFLRENTGADTDGIELRGSDKEFRRVMNIKAMVFSLCPLLISLLKTLNTFFIGSPTVIFTDPGDVTMPTIVASAVPWFGTLILVVCIAYIFYSFYLMGDIKSEIRMKFSDDEHTFE